MYVCLYKHIPLSMVLALEGYSYLRFTSKLGNTESKEIVAFCCVASSMCLRANYAL